ncbi:hypothetical protein DTO280E4_9304 [Paecilomyces variotii]|nr:hypothetical protein DTO280E4_9304 [Paecilomyces variotii]KAJ9395193.1 hypothetical protein DTO282F9_7851 [Paecilomyces variotii]
MKTQLRISVITTEWIGRRVGSDRQTQGRNHLAIAVNESHVGNAARRRSAVSFLPGGRFRARDAGAWAMIAHWTLAINASTGGKELEKEVQHLRSSVSASRSVPNIPTPIESFHADASPVVEQGSSLVNEDIFLPDISAETLDHSTPVRAVRGQTPDEPATLALPSSSTAPRTLEFLHFTGTQISTLFQIFFHHYNPYAPLLDPAVSPDEYYARSPLLFWVIVLVASRRFSEEPGLLVSLTGPVKKILWDAIANPPHTWHIVQAILLACLWPFPTSSLSSDITPILLSAAHTVAVRLGLHRPEAIQDFSRTKRRLSPDEIKETARTWATCYIAAQTVSTTDGQTWVSSDWMVDRLCDGDITGMIPTSLKHQLMISRFMARVCQFMSGHPHGPTGLPRPGDGIPLLALLEREYTELCYGFSDNLSDENNVLLNGAGLQLYVFYLLETSDSDSRKRALLRAYKISTETISKLAHIDAGSDATQYSPISFFRVVCLASMFILKLIYSNLSIFLDIENGKRSFTSAMILSRRVSIEDNDLPGRTSKILTQLWSAQARSGQRDKEPGLKLKTRLAASLLHDSLWTWREEFGGQRSMENTPPGGTRGQNVSIQDPNSTTSQDVAYVDGLTLEDVVDAEILALLPFSLDADALLGVQG